MTVQVQDSLSTRALVHAISSGQHDSNMHSSSHAIFECIVIHIRMQHPTKRSHCSKVAHTLCKQTRSTLTKRLVSALQLRDTGIDAGMIGSVLARSRYVNSANSWKYHRVACDGNLNRSNRQGDCLQWAPNRLNRCSRVGVCIPAGGLANLHTMSWQQTFILLA
jgi:hypothetical protein